MEAVLITEDTGVLLVCNLLQSQDASTQTDAIESRVVLGSSLSLGLLERRPETKIQEAIPLMLGSSSLGGLQERWAPHSQWGVCLISLG